MGCRGAQLLKRHIIPARWLVRGMKPSRHSLPCAMDASISALRGSLISPCNPSKHL